MSHIIMKHAASLEKFLLSIKNSRHIYICDAYTDSSILNPLNLTGNEERPYSEEEIDLILKKYVYFKPYFSKKELWLKPRIQTKQGQFKDFSETVFVTVKRAKTLSSNQCRQCVKCKSNNIMLLRKNNSVKNTKNQMSFQINNFKLN